MLANAHCFARGKALSSLPSCSPATDESNGIGTGGPDTSAHVFYRHRLKLALDACQALQACCHVVRNEVLDFSTQTPQHEKQLAGLEGRRLSVQAGPAKAEVWIGGIAASRPMCGVIMSVYYAMDRMSTEVPEGCNGLIGNIP